MAFEYELNPFWKFLFSFCSVAMLSRESARGTMGRTNELTLNQSSLIGHMVIVKCNLCHRQVHYLAADLAELLGPQRRVFSLPFRCEKCRKSDYLLISVRIPDSRDFGKIILRRPAGIKKVLLWKEERLR
ncbi:hypothetical protein [Roseibium polysiphoniae]|uniref:Uncharacterized protein n=1 Tax=Roseibium polysiphoniae TaxID=2571221 RepID=A0ABR9C771_9HYPH|nr:hypothetical protein [Roseibium polysiphoniae]MBD8875443.1 hypothetical protein [Roseibium polysiphoniae]